MNKNINEAVTKLQELFPEDLINLSYFEDDCIAIKVGTMSTPKLSFSVQTNRLSIREVNSLATIQKIIEILAEVNADV
ncbi:hypothetical protein [Limosilactobacillus reuteri]|uniref:hypothetical protein n=1 Tax=Limosilactobacillus reuteri TaxID=1598 RepID=UPI00214A9762|nr:hypothetical protein [Limosilactobacillus reuteri]MCR1878952.1 hypothetical protein [Limosilactobacillus reuteri]